MGRQNYILCSTLLSFKRGFDGFGSSSPGVTGARRSARNPLAQLRAAESRSLPRLPGRASTPCCIQVVEVCVLTQTRESVGWNTPSLRLQLGSCLPVNWKAQNNWHFALLIFELKEYLSVLLTKWVHGEHYGKRWKVSLTLYRKLTACSSICQLRELVSCYQNLKAHRSTRQSLLSTWIKKINYYYPYIYPEKKKRVE